MSDFLRSFLFTAVPAAAIGIFSASAAWASQDSEPYGYLLLWLLGPIALIVTMVVGLAVRSFRRTTAGKAGILAGIGFAIVALGVSCFSLYGL